MIKVSVFYPNTEGSRFDMDYYCSSHIPMVRQKLGAACKGAAVEQASPVQPRVRGQALSQWATLYFDTVEALQTAFGPHAEAIMADIPNYTDIQPTLQISEVKI